MMRFEVTKKLFMSNVETPIADPTTTLQPEADLEQFADKLLSEKNWVKVTDPEVKAQLKQDLLESLSEAINAMIVRELAPAQIEQLIKLSEGHDQAALQNFVSTNIPDLDQKLATTFIQFRQQYIAE
jgi:hypothetical protein